jgi:hypothetical protein
MKRIKKIICKILGHDFQAEKEIQSPHGIIALKCKRCKERYTGYDKEWNELFN